VAIDVPRQVRAEDALFKQLSRFRAVVMEAPLGVQFLDEEGRVLDCNPAMLAMLGYSVEEMRGRRSTDFLDPADAGRNIRLWEALVKGEPDHYQNENRYMSADGSQIRVRETVSRLSTPSADMPFAFTLVEEFSASVQAEKPLDEGETRLRAVLSGLPVVMWAADRDGTILLCEGKGLAGFDLASGALVGRPIQDLPGDHPERLAYCQKALAGEDVAVVETVQGKAYQAWYSPLTDSRGAVTGLIAIWMDISERKEAEEDLRCEEALLKQALDKMPIGIWFTDAKGKICSGNPAGRALWGGPGFTGPEWFTETKAWFAGTGRPIQADEWAVTRAVEKGETSLNELIEIEAADGAHKTILNSAIPLQDAHQKIVAAVVVNEDITERIHTERELAEVNHRLLVNAETERLRLAQDLHDGPIQDLYGISFQIHELQDALQHTEFQPVITSAHETLRQVISVLRRLCSEMRPPALAPFGLEKAIRSHTESFCKRNPDLPVQLQLVPDGQQLPEQVRMGFFRIYQELLNNVVRHAQASQITVQFGLDVEYGWLEVADNGRGFEIPHRWVDLVRQGHLGLVGIQERTEALGGSLTIQSSAGGGTRVRVVIPRDAEREGFPNVSLKRST
jgi:PAS domain S-box-containing protein